jgi:hypothetical protein
MEEQLCRDPAGGQGGIVSENLDPDERTVTLRRIRGITSRLLLFKRPDIRNFFASVMQIERVVVAVLGTNPVNRF